MNHDVKQEWQAIVHAHQSLCSQVYVLDLAVPSSFPQPQPGQFLMLSVGSDRSVLLRRPMAFCDFTRSQSCAYIKILYAVVGKGTRLLSEQAKGTCLSLLGPIGNSFGLPKSRAPVVFVTGGVGLAPVVLWLRSFYQTDKTSVRVLFGSRTVDQLAMLNVLSPWPCPVLTAVEQGGGDCTGTVVDLLASLQLAADTHVFSCGPPAMLRAVAQFCQEHRLQCYVSVEAKMGCGMGVCLSCVTDFPSLQITGQAGPEKWPLVCQDGPVFRVSD